MASSSTSQPKAEAVNSFAFEYHGNQDKFGGFAAMTLEARIPLLFEAVRSTAEYLDEKNLGWMVGGNLHFCFGNVSGFKIDNPASYIPPIEVTVCAPMDYLVMVLEALPNVEVIPSTMENKVWLWENYIVLAADGLPVEGSVPVLFHADPHIDIKTESLIWQWQGPTAQLQVRVPRPEVRIFDLIKLLGGLLDPGQVRLEPKQFEPLKGVTSIPCDFWTHPYADEILQARYELSRILVYYVRQHPREVILAASRPRGPSLTVSEKGVSYGFVRKYIGCLDPKFLGDWDEHDAEHLRRLLNVKFSAIRDDATRAGNIPLHNYWLHLFLQTKKVFGGDVE